MDGGGWNRGGGVKWKKQKEEREGEMDLACKIRKAIFLKQIN